MQHPAVLITGASSGIGQALALKLADNNYQVFASVRTEQAAKELEESTQGKIVAVQMDVTDQLQVADVFDKISKLTRNAGLFALINNAGVVVSAPLEFVAISDIQMQLETNVIGVMRVTQAALPLLRIAKGRILNIGSPSGRVVVPFLATYSASKAALTKLTQALRMELHPWKIQATLIEPGDIATPIWEKSREAAAKRKMLMNNNVEQYYGVYLERLEKMANQTAQRAISVDVITQAITKLLSIDQLKPTYSIGRTAYLWRIIAQLIPQGLLERFLRRTFNL